MNEPRKTHLRVDFIVQEVADDDSVPTDDLRYIRFGDDVQLADVRDFFDRCGNAMGLMFRATGPSTITLTSCGPNKIAAIKVLRELGGYGLKEAKDFIESPGGTPILIVPHPDDVKEVVHRFAECGTGVHVRALTPRDAHDRPGLNLPMLGTYTRPR